MDITSMCASALANWGASVLGTRYIEDGTHTVYDVGFELIPNVRFPEYVLLLAMAAPVLGIAMVQGFASTATAIGRVMPAYTALMILRAVVTVATIFPKSDAACDSRAFTWINLFHGQCWDSPISGHLAFATFLAIATMPMWPVGATYILANAVLMIASRGHYTSDIIIGIALAALWPLKAVTP